MTEIRNVDTELARFRTRVLLALLALLFAFGLLAARMVYLQVLKHDELRLQAESNRTAVLPLPPQRGQILDRHGRLLASNYAAYTLEITPARVPDLDATLAALGELLPISPLDQRRFRRLLQESHRFDSLPIRSRLTEVEVARFAAQRFRFPGVEVRARLIRHYPLGATASHVLGYIARINQRDKERMAEWPQQVRANYRGTDHIGRTGIEQSFESVLHGVTGYERVETTAGGRAVRMLANTAPQPGNNVILTIDIRLQALIEEMFGTRRGALVAIDPRNGEVLAFVSMPTFDPNLFVDGIDVESWRALNESIDRPLFNRALRGTYPPGSTYKPFMGLAALELGLRSAETEINDPGFWMLGTHRFRSHGDKNLGRVNLRRSIVNSSNVYYYTLAHEMGVDAIHDFMLPLGFGQLSGIDLVGEARGVLPSRAWKRGAFRRPQQQRWFVGETISLGIGQGYNSFTMLQLARAMATLANAGVAHRPRLGLAIETGTSGERRAPLVAPPVDLGYRSEHLAEILSAMHASTTEGTAARVFAGAAYASGGKTGTAQAVTIAQTERYDARRLQEHQRNHSLYVAFAPLENPRVALAVVVENAGFGAAHAAPIARRVFDYLLLDQHPNAQDMQALRQGLASAPIGTPLIASQMPWPPPDLAGAPVQAAPASASGTSSVNSAPP
ncbi:penicillin-binding protein 2 [Hydrogenophaga sp.]|uniref:penicillin-binding protein 2 n=1 Tax=Hydrogenophaga sp. TaxID=1904254 RepID=UPI0019A46965|nr:penicillin-binding protein 2 [Hydrogenophaga sp.]MBD3893930.1 penicillin-binding protein 2 [Hydrogenophaga sp.]